MKKICLLCLAAVLLSGCAAQATFETLADVYAPQALPEAAAIEVLLPEETGVSVIAQGEEKLYLCDGYTMTIQTFAAGDLAKTVEALTGLEKLTLMQTLQGDVTRYEGVWSCAGEGGDQVGRLCVLDDGTYHYTLTVLGPAADAAALTQVWKEILDTFTISRTG